MNGSLLGNLAQIGALIHKEILALVKDPHSRIVLFAPANTDLFARWRDVDAAEHRSYGDVELRGGALP